MTKMRFNYDYLSTIVALIFFLVMVQLRYPQNAYSHPPTELLLGGIGIIGIIGFVIGFGIKTKRPLRLGCYFLQRKIKWVAKVQN